MAERFLMLVELHPAAVPGIIRLRKALKALARALASRLSLSRVLT